MSPAPARQAATTVASGPEDEMSEALGLLVDCSGDEVINGVSILIVKSS